MTSQVPPNIMGLWNAVSPYIVTATLCVIVVIAFLTLMYSVAKLARMLWAASVIVLKTLLFLFIMLAAIVVIVFTTTQLSGTLLPNVAPEDFVATAGNHLQRGRVWIGALVDFMKSNITVRV